jgi:hypothetical protein
MDLFKRIRHAISSDLFTKSEYETAAMDIYLTATDVRPACMPFYGLQLSSPDVLNASKLPEIVLFFGPFGDTNDNIHVIANRAHLRKTEDLLNIIPKLRIQRNSFPAKEWYTNPKARKLNHALHQCICAGDIMYTAQGETYVVEYRIDSETFMPVACATLTNAKLRKCAELLRDIKVAIEPLKKSVQMVVQITQV